MRTVILARFLHLTTERSCAVPLWKSGAPHIGQSFFCHLTQCEQVFMGTITNSFSAIWPWSNLVRKASLRNGRGGLVPLGTIGDRKKNTVLDR